ncbi:hypothetical protein ABZY36_38465, partial [Streptomyces sp. NPDC006627]|uniref:hypothetical protein n=1 Tax=Streptomyces sp. NPDC006627 TaxID=3154679 RepID=UPI0033AE176F
RAHSSSERSPRPMPHGTSPRQERHATHRTQPRPRGSTTHTYDPRGLPTKGDYSDSTPDVTFGYDATVRMASRVNTKISEDFGYDTVGNPTKTRGLAHTYDAADQLTSATTSTTTTAYAYDPLGLFGDSSSQSHCTGRTDEIGGLSGRLPVMNADAWRNIRERRL